MQFLKITILKSSFLKTTQRDWLARREYCLSFAIERCLLLLLLLKYTHNNGELHARMYKVRRAHKSACKFQKKRH
jgi:hypothetical protein